MAMSNGRVCEQIIVLAVCLGARINMYDMLG